MNRRLCFACFLMILLCGGCVRSRQETVRVVTSVEITAARDGQLLSRTLTEGEQMRTVLQYLRKLDPYTPTPLSPDSFRTDAYQIIVSYSDGEHTVYRQIYDRYFQIPDGSWRLIDPELGQLLSGLFDTETACIFEKWGV